MAALKEECVGLSLKEMWLRNGNSDNGIFFIICDVGEAGLSCLRKWMDPLGFQIMLSQAVGDICTLLLSVMRELSLDRLAVLSGEESLSSDALDEVSIMRNFHCDVDRIECLLRSFYNPRVADEAKALIRRAQAVRLLRD